MEKNCSYSYIYNKTLQVSIRELIIYIFILIKKNLLYELINVKNKYQI